jgi:hypothetical protein
MKRYWTYNRYRLALDQITRCVSIEEAHAIAEVTLHNARTRGTKKKCIGCGLRTAGFPASPKSKFCSPECRVASVKAKLQKHQTAKLPSASTAREIKAVAMRSEGMTYTEIGRALGVCNERARQLVVAASRTHQARQAGKKCERPLSGSELLRRWSG